MNIKNLFKPKEKIEVGTISLTFKMPLNNFISYFKSNFDWAISFGAEELQEITQAIKQARKGKSQELIFEDNNKK